MLEIKCHYLCVRRGVSMLCGCVCVWCVCLKFYLLRVAYACECVRVAWCVRVMGGCVVCEWCCWWVADLHTLRLIVCTYLGSGKTPSNSNSRNILHWLQHTSVCPLETCDNVQ